MQCLTEDSILWLLPIAFVTTKDILAKSLGHKLNNITQHAQCELTICYLKLGSIYKRDLFTNLLQLEIRW